MLIGICQFPFERRPRRYGQPAPEEVGASSESVQGLYVSNGYTNVEQFLDGFPCFCRQFGRRIFDVVLDKGSTRIRIEMFRSC